MVEMGIRGRILNISSGATVKVSGMPVDYCVAKSGINTMTKALADVLGKYGITVNCILPGPIPTKINKWQFDDPEIREQLRTATKLCEFGDTSYIADAVVYFVSDGAKWTTGAMLNVDGGFVV